MSRARKFQPHRTHKNAYRFLHYRITKFNGMWRVWNSHSRHEYLDDNVCNGRTIQSAFNRLLRKLYLPDTY